MRHIYQFLLILVFLLFCMMFRAPRHLCFIIDTYGTPALKICLDWLVLLIFQEKDLESLANHVRDDFGGFFFFGAIFRAVILYKVLRVLAPLLSVLEAGVTPGIRTCMNRFLLTPDHCRRFTALLYCSFVFNLGFFWGLEFYPFLIRWGMQALAKGAIIIAKQQPPQ